MRAILFLDFDGVIAFNQPATGPRLSGLDRLLPAPIARLNRLVHALDARVVVSSTWRDLGCWLLLSWLRARGYTGTLDGVTPTIGPDSEDIEQWRGKEIAAWRGRSRAPWVALDDLPLLHCPRLVQVKGGALSDADVERAIEMVRGEVKRAA